MKQLPHLIERNRSFAENAHEPLPPLPTLNAIIVCCMDARTDPSHFLGLNPGEALVVRNAGGRVTQAVEDELTMLVALAAQMGAPPPEVMVVQHTQCGMQRLADPGLRDRVSAASGVTLSALEGLAIHDLTTSLATDCARLARRLPADVRVTGLLLDLATGVVEVSIPDASE